MRLVKEALGAAAEAVSSGHGNVGRNPARLISAWQDFLLHLRPRAGGPRPRRTDLARNEARPRWKSASCTSALFNLVFAEERALTVMCPYDTSGLGDEVLAGAERSHPVCASPHGKAVSPRYSLDAPLEGTLAQPRRPSVTLDFGRADLAMVRHLVAQCARSAGLDSRRNEDLVLAVCEVATNSVQHGGGNGRLHVWDEDGELVCAVHDAGRIADPLVGRQRPRPDEDHGRGLWIANQLCDLVQVRSGEAGTDVRLRMRFDG